MTPLFSGSAKAARAARSAAQKDRPAATPAPPAGQGRPPGLLSGASPVGRGLKQDQGRGADKAPEPFRPRANISLTPPHPAFWQEVGATATCGLGLRPNFSLVGQWVLVLSALNIPHRLIRQGENFYLYVPVMHA